MPDEFLLVDTRLAYPLAVAIVLAAGEVVWVLRKWRRRRRGSVGPRLA